MNGRAIPGAYLFRLHVCDKEMSWPHYIGETHQPDWVVYVRDSFYRNLREITFRLTNVIPERIIFVSRGITVLQKITQQFGPARYTTLLWYLHARHANQPHKNGCGSLSNRLDAPDLYVQNKAQQRAFENTAMSLKVHKLCMAQRVDKEL